MLSVIEQTFKTRLKVWLSTRLLDATEALPSFNSGPIQHLQFVREKQRKACERDFANSKLPDNGKLIVPHLLMFHIYPIEDIDLLLSSIEKTFGNGSYDMSFSALDQIRGSESQLWGSNWSVVGRISARRTDASGTLGDFRLDKRLPSQIEHIEITVHKLLPSTFILAFVVSLADEVGERLTQLHRTEYLGEIEFKNWIPFGTRARIYDKRWISSDHVRMGRIAHYQKKLELESEQTIRRWFPGPRLTRNKPLPVLTDLRLQTSDLVPFDGSLNASCFAGWCDSLQMRPLVFNSFLRTNIPGSSKLIFTFGDGSSRGGERWTLFSIFKENPEGFAATETAAIAEVLITPLAIRHLLATAAEEVGYLRVTAYRRVMRSNWPRRFRRDLKLHSRLQVQKFLVDRLRLERAELNYSLSGDGGPLQQFMCSSQSAENLPANFAANFELSESLVAKHAELVSELFQGFVNAKNLELSYRLSRQVLIWTILVTILTLTTCVATFDQSVTQFGKFKSWLGIKAAHDK